MSVVYKCDKCGKVFDKDEGFILKFSNGPAFDIIDAETFDLCEACTEEFIGFMRKDKADAQR